MWPNRFARFTVVRPGYNTQVLSKCPRYSRAVASLKGIKSVSVKAKIMCKNHLRLDLSLLRSKKAVPSITAFLADPYFYVISSEEHLS